MTAAIAKLSPGLLRRASRRASDHAAHSERMALVHARHGSDAAPGLMSRSRIAGAQERLFADMGYAGSGRKANLREAREVRRMERRKGFTKSAIAKLSRNVAVRAYVKARDQAKDLKMEATDWLYGNPQTAREFERMRAKKRRLKARLQARGWLEKALAGMGRLSKALPSVLRRASGEELARMLRNSKKGPRGPVEADYLVLRANANFYGRAAGRSSPPDTFRIADGRSSAELNRRRLARARADVAARSKGVRGLRKALIEKLSPALLRRASERAWAKAVAHAEVGRLRTSNIQTHQARAFAAGAAPRGSVMRNGYPRDMEINRALDNARLERERKKSMRGFVRKSLPSALRNLGPNSAADLMGGRRTRKGGYAASRISAHNQGRAWAKFPDHLREGVIRDGRTMRGYSREDLARMVARASRRTASVDRRINIRAKHRMEKLSPGLLRRASDKAYGRSVGRWGIKMTPDGRRAIEHMRTKGAQATLFGHGADALQSSRYIKPDLRRMGLRNAAFWRKRSKMPRPSFSELFRGSGTRPRMPDLNMGKRAIAKLGPRTFFRAQRASGQRALAASRKGDKAAATAHRTRRNLFGLGEARAHARLTGIPTHVPMIRRRIRDALSRTAARRREAGESVRMFRSGSIAKGFLGYARRSSRAWPVLRSTAGRSAGRAASSLGRASRASLRTGLPRGGFRGMEEMLMRRAMRRGQMRRLGMIR